MGLPKDLTAEEEYLLKKFALLKKKRKLLQKAKEKTETVKVTKPGSKRVAPEPTHAPGDAKEIAKKLIASGEVKIKKNPQNREFKRTKSESRKQKEGQHGSQSSSQESMSPGRAEEQRGHMKRDLYDRFVPSGGNRGYSNHGQRGYSDERRRGKTIFVTGIGLTEDILHKEFNQFGRVERVHFETKDRERSQGFVTFDNFEAADRAIEEMNGLKVQHVYIKVSMARHQPSMDESNSYSGRQQWPTSRDGRGGPGPSPGRQDPREMVSYELDF